MWGGICYERTLFGLQRALENRVSKYQDKKKAKGEAAVEAYSLVGFPYAFQVWAYEAIPLIGLKYATHVAESYPQILNWSATSAQRSTEVENVFLEPHLTFHSLLTPTLEEQQQDYYKHVDKQGASAEMLHQSNASQDAKKDDLRHEKNSSDTAAYVAAATSAMAEETTNDAIAPSIETGIFEDVTDDEVERNDIPMDVNIDMEASRNLQLAEKHMTKELKDDYSIDDPVIDIAKLFGTPTISGEFSVYVIPHHLSPAIFKRRREIKKSHILQHPLTDPTKRKKLRKEIEKPLTSFDPLRPISEEALESFQKWMSDDQGKMLKQDGLSMPLYSVKWPDVDIVYVPINVRASHWVLGVVHLHRRIIYVYDSLMGINNNARLQVAIKPLAKLLPHILNAIAYYGFHGDTKVNYQEWEIERLQDIPQ
ncbi:uncharacterized protein LOC117917086 [Vitis riparia]|uniref:uncharacterized protein LOC117917086 n=1 Tax=Vitis riparia TaxID=96939 RepID=UPI00155A8616|nr:uncharacterized protein LOC117917086 [Vitis riparia]